MSIFSDLESIRDLYRTGQLDRVDIWQGMRIVHDSDDMGAYMTISFDGLKFPEGVYPEIDGGTYGTLQGIRIYREAMQ